MPLIHAVSNVQDLRFNYLHMDLRQLGSGMWERMHVLPTGFESPACRYEERSGQYTYDT